MFRRKHSRLISGLAYLLCSLLLASLNFGVVYAEFIPSDHTQCGDLLLVFVRGSGQNELSESPRNPYTDAFKKAEPESFAFFNWFKTHLDNEYPHLDYKAVSIHDFSSKYSDVGYRAVGVGIPGQLPNTVNAEASWVPGEYRQSVEQGTIETVGYLKDQIRSCPDQSIVVGGYSQGAQVMGDSLFQLTPDERSKILGVGLFGDPKYIAAKGDSLINPFDSSNSYPWRRGDAANKDTGMLDPRVPYMPDDLAKKTASYCFKSDLVCAGWSGFRGLQDTAHMGYGGEPMRNTVNEMMQWAAPRLSQNERAKGGFDSTQPQSQLQPDNKKRDIMLLINDDSNLGGALNTVRYNTDQVLYPISQKFPNTWYAAKGFGEGEDGTTFFPRVNPIQAFLPYAGYNPNQPMTSVSNLQYAINSRYPFAAPDMGGGDFADPHGLAVERAALSYGWDQAAEKHIVLITDRPPKQDYSYNICNATTRSWLQIPDTNGYSACFLNVGRTDIWPKITHPEICETVYKAITQNDCQNPITKPGYVQMINRTLVDGISVAQSQHIAVDVVVPYGVKNQYDPTVVPKMKADLEYLAKATGGKFIDYNQRTTFDSPTYSDMWYQIFGHAPKDIVVAYKEAVGSEQGFNNKATLTAHANQPIIIDVSQSKTAFSAYKWDFDNNGQWDETSSGPVIQHTFTAPTLGFVRVAGTDEKGLIQAETRLTLAISDGAENPATQPPLLPEITEQTTLNGDIKLSWQSDSDGIFALIDPTSHLIVAQQPLSEGELTFTPLENYSHLEIRVITSSSVSAAVEITVAPKPLPLESPPQPSGDTELKPLDIHPNPLQSDPQDNPSITELPDSERAKEISVVQAQSMATLATETHKAPLLALNPSVFKPQVKGVSQNNPLVKNVAQAGFPWVYNRGMHIIHAHLGIWFSVIVVLAILVGVFELWMLINVAMNDKIINKRKAWWIIGMILIHPFVAIIYFFTDRRKLLK